jgi:mRNA-degrading endonuclease toxin of MazEF toxin-antitoxin module
MPTPGRGRIVWVELLDPQGRNRKRRPAVIITPSEQIQPGVTFYVVGISTRINEAPIEEQIELPWNANGTSMTKLRQRCTAVCSWIEPIKETDIIEYGGVVPPGHLLQILGLVAQLTTPPEETNPDDSDPIKVVASSLLSYVLWPAWALATRAIRCRRLFFSAWCAGIAGVLPETGCDVIEFRSRGQKHIERATGASRV